MFGNSKEYQEIQKLYEEKVSKPEQLDEKQTQYNRRRRKKEEVNITPLSDRDKSDAKKEQDAEKLQQSIKSGEFKKLQAEIEKKKTKGIGPVVDNPDTPDTDEKKEYGKKLNQIKANKEAEANKKREQDKKTDTSSEIESDAKYAQSNKNMNRINKFGKSSVPKLVKSPMETGMGDGAAKARAIAKARIRSGKTIADVKASNTQSMRDRARARNEKFKAERKKKQESKKLGRPQPKVKSPMDMRNESYDAYDIVLEYLLSTEQAATIEEANYVMTEMDAETIQGIIEEQKKNIDEGVPLIPILAKGAAIAGGALLARKGIKDTKKKFDNYLNKQRNQSTFGGNKRVEDTRKNSGDNKVGEKIYYGK